MKPRITRRLGAYHCAARWLPAVQGRGDSVPEAYVAWTVAYFKTPVPDILRARLERRGRLEALISADSNWGEVNRLLGNATPSTPHKEK